MGALSLKKGVKREKMAHLEQKNRDEKEKILIIN